MKNTLLLSAIHPIAIGVIGMTIAINHVALNANAQCQAGFTFNSLNDPTIAFTSACTGASTPTYYWNFGDGDNSYTVDPSHTYSYNGSFNVCLHYSDTFNSSCNVTYCDSVTVTNATPPPCNAQFNYWVDTASGNPVNFGNNSSVYYTSKWIWDFGDGSYDSSGGYIAHQYSVPATYFVCLTVITTSGDTCTYCDSVNTVPCQQQLNVSFTYTLSANIAAFTSNCSGAPIPFYYWSLGDGNYAYYQNVTHTYQYNGTYPVCLTYGDNNTCSKTVCGNITITGMTNTPCNALFSFSSYLDTSNSNTIVAFTDQSSAAIVNWFWDFGDSSTASYQDPQHEYSSTGTYYVCLTVTNQSGISCSYCNDVSIGTNCNSTNAYFTIAPDTAPHVWQVTNLATGVAPVTYAWNWGDSSPITYGETPSHTYATAGWYNICLTISDANGCGSSYCLTDTLWKSSTGTMVSVYVIRPIITGIECGSPAADGFSIFPNPTTGKLQIMNSKLQKEQVEVFNVFGEKLYFSSFVNSGSSFTIDMSGFPQGIYFLHIRTSDDTIVRKLSKE